MLDLQNVNAFPSYTFLARLVPSDERERWVCVAAHVTMGGDAYTTVGLGVSRRDAHEDCRAQVAQFGLGDHLFECTSRREQRALLSTVNLRLAADGFGARIEEVRPEAHEFASRASGDGV
jgi:hypothetical protein